MSITRHDIAAALGEGWDVTAREALVYAYPPVGYWWVGATLPQGQTPSVWVDLEDVDVLETHELDAINAAVDTLSEYIADHYDEVIDLTAT